MSRLFSALPEFRLGKVIFRRQWELTLAFKQLKESVAQNRWMHSSGTQSSTAVQDVKEDDSEVTEVEINFENYLEHPDYFDIRNSVTLKDLFDARVHFGHKKGTRNDFMIPYIFGNRLGVDIIDLDQTLPLMQDALNFLAHIAFRNGVIMFVSRHLQTIPMIESLAEKCGEYSHCRNWQEGSFTNAITFYGSIIRPPDLLVFMSTHDTIFKQHPAVTEAAKLNIPTIGIVDTSCDPRLITYPIPGNDDSPSAIELYCKLFEKAIMTGKAEKRKKDKSGSSV